MKFSELDAKIRVFETDYDQFVPPGVHMVARLDGRNFSRLTKELHDFERPFDARFRDYMLLTTEFLMNCGGRVLYGYTQSDEISLLFHPDDECFGRKVRKIVSIFSGEASARFSSLLQGHAVFDCRVSQLPSIQSVIDYFRWRAEDAHRNSLQAHCYWGLRERGLIATAADKRLKGLLEPEKRSLFRELKGFDFDALPGWQRRGSGLRWEAYTKTSQDPRTGDCVDASRWRLVRNLELPENSAYSDYLITLLEGAVEL